MPQCIAEQDQSTWLSAMTSCIGRPCTRHFGRICTHHQWRTQLSCLSNAISPNVVREYLPYCSRSVLAKAQLHRWIRTITDRTWLAEVGDTKELQNLSPASLVEGYAPVDLTYIAPTCLAASSSARSMESFQHVVASCSFTSTTQHTGNAARPWEYSESLKSVVSLDFETAGYDLVSQPFFHRDISPGDYFDKKCFCDNFALDFDTEPCSDSNRDLDLTKERLWIHATCGPMSLPRDWTDLLKTTEFAYIPIEHWHWPKCVEDIPTQVIKLTDRCATDACELDSRGYCEVKRTVDRACFCRNINYDTCGGSCKIFDTRIDYIKWLHDLCGGIPDWRGLPVDWRQLTAPTTIELIPWQWTLKPSNGSYQAYLTRVGTTQAAQAPEACSSNSWKLGSIALINLTLFLAVLFGRRIYPHHSVCSCQRRRYPMSWIFTGTKVAGLQLLATWLNAFIVQNTLGYENVPTFQLILLWCSLPRPTWLRILVFGGQPYEAMDVSAVASTLLTELILQLLSAYYMLMAVGYGRAHDFYFGGLKGATQATPALFMYIGALLWLLVTMVTSVYLVRAVSQSTISSKPSKCDVPESQERSQKPSNLMDATMAHVGEHCSLLGNNLAHHSGYSSGGQDPAKYGTFPVNFRNERGPPQAVVESYAFMVIILFLLWIAQGLFWSGFINLSSEEYVFMHMLYIYLS